MWPTFYIPNAGSFAQVDCWNFVTKTADTDRTASDGAPSADPELQFATDASKTYQIIGFVNFSEASPVGTPGIKAKTEHTTALASALSQSGTVNFGAWSSTNDSTGLYPSPQFASDFLTASSRYMIDESSSAGVVTYCPLLIDDVITTSTAGTYQVKWGLNDLAAGGTTRAPQYAFFAVRETTDLTLVSKASDETRLSTTAAADDSELSISVEPGTYKVKITAFFRAGSTCDIRIGVHSTATLTSGCGLCYSQSPIIAESASQIDSLQPGNAEMGANSTESYSIPHTRAIGGAGNSSTYVDYLGQYVFEGVFVVSVSGTIALAWCQSTSSGTEPAVMLAGSSISAERLA